MGMSTHVIGFKPPDDEWKRHKAVWDACKAADVDVSVATLRFFNHVPPDSGGVEVDLRKCGAVTDWADHSRSGYEVDLSKVPAGTKTIRFYNSW